MRLKNKESAVRLGTKIGKNVYDTGRTDFRYTVTDNQWQTPRSDHWTLIYQAPGLTATGITSDHSDLKQCGKCSNLVPARRVVNRCDGCLALFYYGNALDEIMRLVDGSYDLSDYVVRSRVRKVTLEAIKTVPRKRGEEE